MTRSELLSSTLTSLSSVWLGILCSGSCTKLVYLPLKKHGRIHQDWPLRRFVARLRCAECGSAPSSVWAVDWPVEGGGHGGRAATWRVELVP